MPPQALLQGVCFSDSYPKSTLVWEKELPLPPSINSYWKVNKSLGRLYVAEEGLEFRRSVRSIVGDSVPLTCRVAMDVILIAPDKRRRDVDNVQKALLDALTHAAVYQDDSQVDDLRIRRGTVQPGKGAILVRLYRLSVDGSTRELVESGPVEMNS